MLRVSVAVLMSAFVCGGMCAQENPAANIQTNHAVTEADGTVRMQRVVPLPKGLSPEAKAWLSRPAGDADVPQTLEQRRTMLDKSQAQHRDVLLKMFEVTVRDSTVAGVPVREVLPKEMKHPDRVLICLHGGGFNADSGSYSESIPVAAMTGSRIVSVLYRMAPEHPFPAGVDDVVAVYRELLKKYRPQHIAIFGSSAGAGLTMQAAVRIKQLKLPMPAALGPFSVPAAMDDGGDSRSLYNTDGLRGYVPVPNNATPNPYVGSTDPRNPVLSPLYADLKGMPPALFLTSERDLLLSSTTMLHRAYLRAGSDGRLVVFEALPHCFWNNASLPETREAWTYMADFFNKQLAHP
ncbi:alpha/beta hydrolase [Terriglobus sp. TAA 43]|uniref:alpha/beta hydrolase n=1 Tax=Terriglobus sp. TAA 43 TaxID=278961 RepID=UPI000645B553|nr:alpha/beta hydrolase fold domain-containing protein [Terriglobus sp. TAA 43]